MARLKGAVREFTRVNHLLLIGGSVVIVGLLPGWSVESWLTRLPWFVAGAFLGTALSGKTSPSRLHIWLGGVFGAFLFTFGVWVAAPPSAAILAGIGLVALGCWVVLDAMAVARIDPYSGVDESVRYEDLHRAVTEIDDAASPVSLTTLASRLDVTRADALSILAILQGRGEVEETADGYEAHNLYLGSSFSIRGFFRRVGRPVRVLRQGL